MAIHLRHDPTATAEFAEAHVRRLEAIRRIVGGVERRPDGTWFIDPDHLDRVAEYERVRTKAAPVAIQVLSAWSLEQQANADGTTWLDRELVSSAPAPIRDAGFGREVRRALERRRQWLIQQGLVQEEEEGRVTYRSNLLAVLRRRELARVGAQLSQELGLKYVELREGQEISGMFRRRIDLASGKAAVVEIGREFTLVPWKPAFEQRTKGIVRGVSFTNDTHWGSGRRHGREIT